ncbi:MAG: hypothetical protein EON88_07480, partial [Brevundimonas sp.]
MQRSHRAALAAGVAMGALSFTSAAWAQCTPESGGVIECAPGSYPQIAITTSDPLELRLAGDITTQRGVSLLSSNDPLTVRAVAGSTLSTTAARFDGLTVEAGDGDIDIDVHDVVSIDAAAINAITDDGDIAIQANQLMVSGGQNGRGIEVLALGGAVDIDVASIVMTGEQGLGAYVTSTNGPIDIDIGSISILNFGAGLSLDVENGPVRIDIDQIDASSDGGGINIQTREGDTQIRAGQITAGAGVFVSSNRGDIDLVADSITALGPSGEALNLTSGAGDIRVDVDRLTSGERGSAVFFGSGQVDLDIGSLAGANGTALLVAGGSGDINVDVETAVFDRQSVDAIALASNGDIHVSLGELRVNETEDPWGARGAAIAASSTAGDVEVVAGDIQLDGGSYGVDVEAGGNISIRVDQMTMADYAGGGVSASSQGGDIDITVGRLTGGESSYGVGARSDSGDITINVDTISIGGSESGGSGISVAGGSGRVDVTAGHVSASSETAGGIIVGSTTGDIHITAGDVFAYEFAGIGAYSDSGDIFVTANGHVSSGEYRALELSTTGAVTLVVGAEGSVSADEWNQVSTIRGDEGVSVLNLGRISGDDFAPYALNVTRGVLTLQNQGVIVGVIGAADGIRFNNAGMWRPTYDMEFRGDDDLLINTGVIQPLHTDPGCCFDPARISLTGLETFQNAGLIDLRGGGSTDNRFDALDATYIGQTGAVFAVDFNLSNGSADQLRFGAIQGQTTLMINYVGEGGGFAAPTTVISSITAASPDAIVLDPDSATSGFTQIALGYDAGDNAFTLQALPSDAALANLRLGWAAQDYASKSGEAWSGRLEDMRDSVWAGTGRSGGVEAWGQAVVGGREQEQVSDFAILGATIRRDISTETDWRGVQYGMDRAFGPVLLGVTGGLLDYDMKARARPDRFALRGFNLGAYAAWLNGPFSLSGMAKVDRFESRAVLRSVDDFS